MPSVVVSTGVVGGDDVDAVGGGEAAVAAPVTVAAGEMATPADTNGTTPTAVSDVETPGVEAGVEVVKDDNDEKSVQEVGVVVGGERKGSSDPTVPPAAPVVDQYRVPLTLLEHRMRNLEKRKSKLDGYKKEQLRGKLNVDQEGAAEKYGEVLACLNFAHDFSKQLTVTYTNTIRLNKKQSRKEQIERTASDIERCKFMIMFQYILVEMSDDSVRQDFLDGVNGAVKLTEEDITLLNKFAALISVQPRTKGFTKQASESSQHMMSLMMSLDGKSSRQVLGKTYKDVSGILLNVQKCGYFDNEPAKVAPVETENEIVSTEAPSENEISLIVKEPSPLPAVVFRPEESVTEEPMQKLISQPIQQELSQSAHPTTKHESQHGIHQETEQVVQQGMYQETQQVVQQGIYQETQQGIPQETQQVVQQGIHQETQQGIYQETQQVVQQGIYQETQQVVQQGIYQETQQVVQQGIYQETQQVVQQGTQQWTQELAEQGTQQGIQQVAQQVSQQARQETLQQSQAEGQQHSQQVTQQLVQQLVQQGIQQLVQQGIQQPQQYYPGPQDMERVQRGLERGLQQLAQAGIHIAPGMYMGAMMPQQPAQQEIHQGTQQLNYQGTQQLNYQETQQPTQQGSDLLVQRGRDRATQEPMNEISQGIQQLLQQGIRQGTQQLLQQGIFQGMPQTPILQVVPNGPQSPIIQLVPAGPNSPIIQMYPGLQLANQNMNHPSQVGFPTDSQDVINRVLTEAQQVIQQAVNQPDYGQNNQVTQQTIHPEFRQQINHETPQVQALRQQMNQKVQHEVNKMQLTQEQKDHQEFLQRTRLLDQQTKQKQDHQELRHRTRRPTQRTQKQQDRQEFQQPISRPSQQHTPKPVCTEIPVSEIFPDHPLGINVLQDSTYSFMVMEDIPLDLGSPLYDPAVLVVSQCTPPASARAQVAQCTPPASARTQVAQCTPPTRARSQSDKTQTREQTARPAGPSASAGELKIDTWIPEKILTRPAKSPARTQKSPARTQKSPARTQKSPARPLSELLALARVENKVHATPEKKENPAPKTSEKKENSVPKTPEKKENPAPKIPEKKENPASKTPEKKGNPAPKTPEKKENPASKTPEKKRVSINPLVTGYALPGEDGIIFRGNGEELAADMRSVWVDYHQTERRKVQKEAYHESLKYQNQGFQATSSGFVVDGFSQTQQCDYYQPNDMEYHDGRGDEHNGVQDDGFQVERRRGNRGYGGRGGIGDPGTRFPAPNPNGTWGSGLPSTRYNRMEEAGREMETRFRPSRGGYNFNNNGNYFRPGYGSSGNGPRNNGPNYFNANDEGGSRGGGSRGGGSRGGGSRGGGSRGGGSRGGYRGGSNSSGTNGNGY